MFVFSLVKSSCALGFSKSGNVEKEPICPITAPESLGNGELTTKYTSLCMYTYIYRYIYRYIYIYTHDSQLHIYNISIPSSSHFYWWSPSISLVPPCGSPSGTRKIRVSRVIRRMRRIRTLLLEPAESWGSWAMISTSGAKIP